MALQLNAFDGMSVHNSTPEDRREVLTELQNGEPSKDSIQYGFYIGQWSGKPVADYGGNMVKREITMMEFKMG